MQVLFMFYINDKTVYIFDLTGSYITKEMKNTLFLYERTCFGKTHS